MVAGFSAFNSANELNSPYQFMKEGLHGKFWEHQEQLEPKRCFEKSFKDLINGMLHSCPDERLTIQEVKAHPWITGAHATQQVVNENFAQRKRQQKEESKEQPKSKIKTKSVKRSGGNDESESEETAELMPMH